MWRITHHAPWLSVAFERPQRLLGWTPQGGGISTAGTVLWREVRNADLPPDFDVLPWLAAETAAIGAADRPCFLTSARIADFAEATVTLEGITARALATAGLGNAERIGQRRRPVQPSVGTINLLLALECRLSFPAELEALSLLAEARTAAVMDHAPALWPQRITGTGTDCLCLAHDPVAERLEIHAGKHTALGEAIGRAAYEACRAAIQRWSAP